MERWYPFCHCDLGIIYIDRYWYLEERFSKGGHCDTDSSDCCDLFMFVNAVVNRV